MIFFRFDGENSMGATARRGHRATLAMNAQIAEVTRRILDGLDGPVYQGEPQGDGVLLGSEPTHALEMLRRAMTIRDEPPWQHPTWLPMRMVVGLVPGVTWPGDRYYPGTGPSGFGIGILARLLEPPDRGGACPPRSLVINGALVEAVQEFGNGLIDNFQILTIDLRGIGPQTYGIAPPKNYPRALVMWKRFEQSAAKPVIFTLGVAAWSLVLRWVAAWIWP